MSSTDSLDLNQSSCHNVSATTQRLKINKIFKFNQDSGFRALSKEKKKNEHFIDL